MPPKKLSGAQNKRRREEKEREDRQLAGKLHAFFKPADAAKQSERIHEEVEGNMASNEGGGGDGDIRGGGDGSDNEFSNLSMATTDETQIEAEDLVGDEGSHAAGGGSDRQEPADTEDWSDPARWPEVMSTAFVDTVVTTGPAKVPDMEFPVDEKKRHFSQAYVNRKLENGEKVKRRWLVYSKSADRVFCFCCKIFRAGPGKLTSSGSNDWQHLAEILAAHERSPAHKYASCEWAEALLRLNLKEGIDSDHMRMIEEEKARWSDILTRLVDITLFLAEHNIAFRGSSDKLFTPNNGNFLGLVELLGKFDNVLGEHLRRAACHDISDHYCSKTIQNELIDLLAKEVLEKITTELKAAKYFSIMLDCTPDISHSEKMSFIVRFVDTQRDVVEVKEHFIGYKTVDESTGEELSEVMFNVLEDNHIDFKDCRGQGYDNGSNMAGKKKGVQARVLERNPRATFVPCGCHSLNLVLSDAASSTTVSVTLFGVLQRIYVLFSASVQRWKMLNDKLGSHSLTVKELSTTRWESRIDSVKAIRYQTKEVYEALLELSQCPKADAGVRTEAASLANKLTEFEFLLSLSVWYDILFQINLVSKAMQSPTMDIARATSIFESCVEFVKSYREIGYEGAVLVAKEIAESMDVEAAFKEPPRKRKKKRTFEYEGHDEVDGTPEEKFKRDFFYPLIDVATTSLQERFKQLRAHKDLWGFLYDIKNLPTPDDLTTRCNDLHQALHHEDHADIDGTELRDELKHLSAIIPTAASGAPMSVLQFIKKTDTLDLFPNAWVALRILLTIPVTVASGERSFSKLKLTKTYLRSTIGDVRLNSLSILSIEKRIARELDRSKLIQKFANIKARKITL